MPQPTASARRAVVLGGGFAGLLAARVLGGHFGEVVVLESDALPGDGHRRGVPQAHHPHALLARGAQLLELLFPGLRDELRARGCPVADFTQATRLRFPAGWAPRAPCGFDVQLVGRTTLDHALLRRVTAAGTVVVRARHRVDGLFFDRAGGPVTVAVHATSSHRKELITADLVVDATGRGTRLPHWLNQAGLHCPSPLVVDGHVTYTSRTYALAASPGRDWLASYQPTLAPHSPRGGVAARIGPDRWLLGLIGAAGRTPPTDEQGFLAYAAGLPNPDFAAIISEAVPLTPLHRTRATANRWQRYHRVPHWPGRLVALGDSVCAFNPVYGQGLTIAAMQSELLDSLLSAYAHDGRADRLGPRFQREAARLVRGAWLLNTSADRGWQGPATPLPSRLACAYLNALAGRFPYDEDLVTRYARTMHMLDSPRRLFSPPLAARLLLASLDGRSRSPGAPAAPEPAPPRHPPSRSPS